MLLAFAVPTASIGTTIRVSPADAENHLSKQTSPVYPPLAQQTRISGVVLLEIVISENGKVTVKRVISGHPLLVYAAMDAVKHWEFQPFEADGQPAEAITFVKVGFASTRRQETEADATMQALSDYWMALDLANKSLVQKDLRGATQRLEIAERLFVANRWRSDTIEQAEWLRASASLATDQGNLPDAEDKYSRALKIFKQIDKGSLATARTLALLGEVYLHEGKYNPARDTFGKAVKLYVELFNESDDRDSASRKTCGASIASISLLLSKAAAQQKDNAELNKNCQVVVKFREYLGEADRQSLTSTCQQDAAN